MRYISLLLVFLLYGCISNPPTPGPIKTVIVKEEVPVPVPCRIKPVNKPELSFSQAKKEHDIFTKSQLAMAELEAREAYEKELEAAVKECQ